MKPHEFSILVNEIMRTVNKYGGTQQLREQVVKTLSRNSVKPEHKK